MSNEIMLFYKLFTSLPLYGLMYSDGSNGVLMGLSTALRENVTLFRGHVNTHTLSRFSLFDLILVIDSVPFMSQSNENCSTVSSSAFLQLTMPVVCLREFE